MAETNLNINVKVGRITWDPEYVPFKGGGGVCKFQVATHTRITNKTSGEVEEKTCYTDVAVFGKFAETCRDRVVKGMKISVVGYDKTEEWIDKPTGKKRRKNVLVADQIEFLAYPKDTKEGATTEPTTTTEEEPVGTDGENKSGMF